MSSLEPWVLRRENLSCLPVLHYRIEFADQVRLLMHEDPPDCVAIELPSHLTEAFLRAVARLPRVSILLYETPGKQTFYLPVEPVDPFAEAARSALERGIPVYLVDLNLEESYPSFHDAVPDPYAMHAIGPETYYETFRALRREDPSSVHPFDLRRERGMAYRLARLLERHRRVLFVCGMAHGHGVLKVLETPQALPLERVHPPPVQAFHLHPDSLEEVMATFPLLSAVYETRRKGLPPEPEPDRFTLRRSFRIGSAPFTLLGKEGPVYDEEAALRASSARIARRAGFPGGERADVPTPVDRNRFLLHLFEEAQRHYHQETGERIEAWQKRIFWRFARNYAWTHGLLLPDFYPFLVAGRSCVDDNFCYALWRLGRFYPWQEESSDLPTLRVSGDEVWLGTRRIYVRRWLPSKKRRPRPLRGIERKRERAPGEWLQAFDGRTLCSYPPEDLVIEAYGRQLRETWDSILREEDPRSEPLTVSLLDGIDVRETIRRRTENRIYVKSRQRAKGPAGAVVVIFDEDPEDRRYPYRMTWLGEHEQESDMAFYATDPADNIVGPGICRCEYGGFLMSYPPRRLYDVWRDPDYLPLASKPEVLLAAALDYSLERYVVYVAPRPPRSRMQTLAERLRRQIVYVPFGSLSPAQLKRIRVFHILSGHDKRELARHYIH